ncbi:MAG TPA: hypothetical protein VGI81_15075 [Tepidisphaeraceae bacterium]|jgi:hypothetical protein
MKRILLIFATVLCAASLARAEHFRIELTVKGTSDEATAHSDTDPPPQGTQPRPVCHVKRGEPFTIQFFFSSNFPHDVQKNVTVRFFVAPERAAGKKSPPDRDKPPVTESNFLMDFKPDTGRVGLRQRLRIDRPGAYLVKVGSEHSDSDHEHFAAVDLVVD